MKAFEMKNHKSPARKVHVSIKVKGKNLRNPVNVIQRRGDLLLLRSRENLFLLPL